MAAEIEPIAKVSAEKGILFKASKIALIGGFTLLGALAIVKIYQRISQHLRDESAHPEDKKRRWLNDYHATGMPFGRK